MTHLENKKRLGLGPDCKSAEIDADHRKLLEDLKSLCQLDRENANVAWQAVSRFEKSKPSAGNAAFISGINFTRSTDPKGRVNLGSRFANMTFIVKQGSDETELILTASSVIPLREMWLHKNPEAFASVMRGIQQIADGEVSDSPPDIDADCPEDDSDSEE